MRHVLAKLTWKKPTHTNISLQKLHRAEQRAMTRHEPGVGPCRNELIIARDDYIRALTSNLKAIMRKLPSDTIRIAGVVIGSLAIVSNTPVDF